MLISLGVALTSLGVAGGLFYLRLERDGHELSVQPPRPPLAPVAESVRVQPSTPGVHAIPSNTPEPAPPASEDVVQQTTRREPRERKTSAPRSEPRRNTETAPEERAPAAKPSPIDGLHAMYVKLEDSKDNAQLRTRLTEKISELAQRVTDPSRKKKVLAELGRTEWSTDLDGFRDAIKELTRAYNDGTLP
jgi:hypothetical protein